MEKCAFYVFLKYFMETFDCTSLRKEGSGVQKLRCRPVKPVILGNNSDSCFLFLESCIMQGLLLYSLPTL